MACASLIQLTTLCQSNGYILETYGSRNGLLSSKIYALAQSNDRMLWIGTELGASRYDGYSFINYQYTTTNESVGRVLCITQDSVGGMWIGGDKGLFYESDGQILRINLRSRPTVAVEALLTDAAGNVWVGELNALYKLTPGHIRSIRQQQLSTIDLAPHANFTKRVFGLAVDNKQAVYASSFDGIFKLQAQTNTFDITWANPDPNNFVRSVAVTSPDSIYWNRLEGHPEQMIRGKQHNYYTREFLGRHVFSHRNRVYALTTSGVSLVGDGAIHPLVFHTAIANNAVAAIIDEEENIWVGTWEGLLKFRKSAFQQYRLQDDIHTEVFSMLERKNGELLFGSNRGKIFIKNKNQIVPHPGIPALFPHAEVMCMAEAGDGSFWAGSGYEGISRWKDKKLQSWAPDSLLKDNNCEALYAAARGKLFACTEQGVTVIDPLASPGPFVAHFGFEKKYTRYPELFGCFQTGSSDYWFYGSQGLYRLQRDKLVDDSISGMPVKSLYINRIVADKKGNVWIATLGKGLLKCKLQGGRLVLKEQYDSKKALPSDNALSVLVDKNDNVWLGDYMSLSLLIDPGASEQLITFNEKDGLFSSYYQSLKLEQQRDGTIWALTSMGAVSFHADSIGRNNLPPILLMDRIRLQHGDTIPAAAMLRLSYKNNSPEFHYTAVCLTDPSKIRYAYRLKEVDSNWTYTSSRSVSFNFLRSGQYTFELKACNNNNVWTPQPLRFSFTIRPPFWQTWWFRLLVIAVIALLSFLLFRRRLAVVKARGVIRQQMAELEAKAIRAQMNPHFIFNSLNAIQESIVLNDYDTSYQYLSKFSKLLRLVLNNSEKNLIPLRDEIEMNRLYLELESLRFKHSFHYTILVDDNIDPDMMYFPSLMLQPFIENAVWHGLMHKDGEKKLMVHFRLRDQQLECIIEDNGIGREKAAMIKKQKLGAQYFESKGTDLARQRMRLLQESGTLEAGLVIEDLAHGTRVTIRVPLRGRMA